MKKKINKVNAAILIIGNEILSGRTQDKNIAFLSKWLNTRCGISVNEVRVIPDIEKNIVENILINPNAGSPKAYIHIASLVAFTSPYPN